MPKFSDKVRAFEKIHAAISDDGIAAVDLPGAVG
jgi:hypothetical protein